MDYKQLYNDAHFLHFQQEYPKAYKDGFYCKPKMPVITKANGLTVFIINYLNWCGHNATRISSAGVNYGGQFRRSTTRSGTADITATIKGRSVKIEIKIGKDKASEDQLKEQARERKAGGIYEFVSNPETFFLFYFKFMQEYN
jgi:hypothetical protein